MITRHHRELLTHSTAVYSDCERYRYWLKRRWTSAPLVNFLMLNPSTATERDNDPTVDLSDPSAVRAGQRLAFGDPPPPDLRVANVCLLTINEDID